MTDARRGYDVDFYAWTQSQADSLRRRSANALDYERLAEEIADLGRRDRRAVMSYATVLLEHLYKLACSAAPAPKAGWRREVLAHRRSLNAALTLSLRDALAAELDALHSVAADLAEAGFDAHADAGVVDRSLRWSLAQLLGETSDELTER